MKVTKSKALLTSTLVHAPGLSPDLEGVWLLLQGEVAVGGVVGGQAWQGLGGGGGRGTQCLTGHHHGWVAGGVGVGATVAAHAVLGAILAVFPLQLLGENTHNIRREAE